MLEMLKCTFAQVFIISECIYSFGDKCKETKEFVNSVYHINFTRHNYIVGTFRVLKTPAICKTHPPSNHHHLIPRTTQSHHGQLKKIQAWTPLVNEVMRFLGPSSNSKTHW